MKNSLVILENLTPTCTELARHLVLSGINIWLRDAPDTLVTAEDVDSDFLCCEADIGQKVSRLWSITQPRVVSELFLIFTREDKS